MIHLLCQVWLQDNCLPYGKASVRMFCTRGIILKAALAQGDVT